MLEHVLSQNKSQIMPEHVLVMLAKTENGISGFARMLLNSQDQNGRWGSCIPFKSSYALPYPIGMYR